MVERITKEKQQIIILSILLGILLVVVGYARRDVFLPRMTAPADGGIGAVSRAAITVKETEDLFQDARFTALEKNLDIGLSGSTSGNAAVFAAPSP